MANVKGAQTKRKTEKKLPLSAEEKALRNMHISYQKALRGLQGQVYYAAKLAEKVKDLDRQELRDAQHLIKSNEAQANHIYRLVSLSGLWNCVTELDDQKLWELMAAEFELRKISTQGAQNYWVTSGLRWLLRAENGDVLTDRGFSSKIYAGLWLDSMEEQNLLSSRSELSFTLVGDDRKFNIGSSSKPVKEGAE